MERQQNSERKQRRNEGNGQHERREGKSRAKEEDRIQREKEKTDAATKYARTTDNEKKISEQRCSAFRDRSQSAPRWNRSRNPGSSSIICTSSIQSANGEKRTEQGSENTEEEVTETRRTDDEKEIVSIGEARIHSQMQESSK